MNILADISLHWSADTSPHLVENHGMDFKVGETGANYKNVQQPLVSEICAVCGNYNELMEKRSQRKLIYTE